VAKADGTTFRLTDLDGRPVRLADLRGKAVWINFWASWCPPCQSETPILRDVAARYRERGLVVVGISVQETTASDVAAYVAKYQLGYTVAADVTGEIYRLYRPPGLPTQIFIGPDGAVRSFVLAPLTLAGAIAQVEAILPPAASVPSPSVASSPSPPVAPTAAAGSATP
jgi:peroxiredoxin